MHRLLHAGILATALLSPLALAEESAHLVATGDGFETTHGLTYTISGEGMIVKGPKHRSDWFGEVPYEISLGALIADEGVVMVHAERVADRSGASNYRNLARSLWPDDSFRFSGVTCIDVPASDVEGEFDLEWLRDNGYEPSGPMVFVQYYSTTDDFNDEIVITLLARVAACTPELQPADKLAPLRERVVITRAE